MAYKPVENAVTSLFSKSGNPLASVEVVATKPSVTLEPELSHSLNRGGDKPHEQVVLLLKPANEDTTPDIFFAAIQNSLGGIPIIQEVFNGLQPHPANELQAEIEALTKHQSPDASQGLLAEEVEALKKWQTGKENGGGHYWYHGNSGGANIRTSSDSPININYYAAHDEDANTLKQNLESRLPEIRTQLIEDAKTATTLGADGVARPVLNEAEIAEITNLLRIDIKEEKYGEQAEVSLKIGIPDTSVEDKDKLPNGEYPLKVSAFNKLMETYAKDAKQSVGEGLIRHHMTYTGENWLQAFGQTAGNEEVQGYLQHRAAGIANDGLKKEVEQILKNDVFLDDDAKAEKRKHATADFKISSPTTGEKENHPDTYRMRLKLPENVTIQQVFDSITAHAASHAKPHAEPAPTAAPVAESKPAEQPPVSEVKSELPDQTQAISQQPVENAVKTPATPAVIGDATAKIAAERAAANDQNYAATKTGTGGPGM